MKAKKKLTIQAITEIKNGELIAIASDETVDRVGDKIKIVDWDFKNFKKNPVLQAGHDYRPEFTIGRARNLRVEGKKVIFTPEFHGITQLSQEIEQMYRKQYLKAWSVGFIPAREEGDSHELLEVSAVAVPANPNALTSIKSLQKEATKYDEKTVKDIESWVKKTEEPSFHVCQLRNPDSFNKGTFKTKSRKSKEFKKSYNVITGKLKGEDTLIEQSFEYNSKNWTSKDARKHCKTSNGKDFTKANESKSIKGVIPHKDHGKAVDSTKWNGPSEVKKASVSDLLVMSSWYDSENPTVKASYKLPHHKANGTHVAIWNGVKSAMGALLGSKEGVDVPASDRKGIYTHLKKHYAEFEKDVPKFKKYKKAELKELEKKGMIILKKKKSKKIEKVINEVVADVKEGKVISKRNKTIIQEAVESSIKAVGALEKLLELSKAPEKAIRPDSPKSRKEQKVKEPVKKINTDDVTRAVLKRIVGMSSNALRNINKKEK